MCASPLSFLRAGPPPPKVVLLPDALFFTRALPVVAGATAAEVAAQVELALEALSPFPVAQLYHGHYWPAGAERVLVFAAYRRRFSTEQAAAWAGAELVLPVFAALLGSEPAPATTVLLASVDGVTAVHWDHGPVPAQVLFRPLDPLEADLPAEVAEAKTAANRALVRDELLRMLGGSKMVIDLAAVPAAEPTDNDQQVVFRAGEWVSRLPAAAASALDVRDKNELALLHRAKVRDLWLWRAALGCAAAVVLLAVGELALVGGTKLWQKARVALVSVQKSPVEKIKNADELATRIDDLATKRLLPFEMITIVSGPKPTSIQFVSTVTDGISKLRVSARTNNAGDIGVYQMALEKLPGLERVEIVEPRTVGGNATFTLVVTFSPAALKPGAPAS